jgi:hypothetical protein
MSRFEIEAKKPGISKTGLHDFAKRQGRRFALFILHWSYNTCRVTILKHLDMDFGLAIAPCSMHLIDLGVGKYQLTWTLGSLAKDQYRIFYQRVQEYVV